MTKNIITAILLIGYQNLALANSCNLSNLGISQAHIELINRSAKTVYESLDLPEIDDYLGPAAIGLTKRNDQIACMRFQNAAFDSKTQITGEPSGPFIYECILNPTNGSRSLAVFNSMKSLKNATVTPNSKNFSFTAADEPYQRFTGSCGKLKCYALEVYSKDFSNITFASARCEIKF